MTLNGKTRFSLTVAAALAIVSAVFVAGMSYRDVSKHVSAVNGERHETAGTKIERIDRRIESAMKPIEKQLDNLAADGKKRDEQLAKIMDYLINGRN